MKGKVLVISVGTGTGQDAQESLAHGIVVSVKTHNPDYIVFITSSESKEKTLPLIFKEAGKELLHEVIILTDVEDIGSIYETLSCTFIKLKRAYSSISVDFTSGTKAMTGALSILGTLFEVRSLSYITGVRENGVVVQGTERILDVLPLNIIADKKLNEAVVLFNRHQYESVLLIIKAVEKEIPSKKIKDKFGELKSCARAYSAWDKFDHAEAALQLADVHNVAFNENKRFLNELAKSQEKEPRYIADLLNNARRRAIEGKYDDAVARLYRTIELLSQYSLKKHGIADTSAVPMEQIPESLVRAYRLTGINVKVALDLGWRILAAKGDPAGLKYITDNNIKDSLSKRNNSILAHGLKSLSEEDFNSLLSPVLQYTRMKIANTDQFMQFALFREWPE